MIEKSLKNVNSASMKLEAENDLTQLDSLLESLYTDNLFISHEGDKTKLESYEGSNIGVIEVDSADLEVYGNDNYKADMHDLAIDIAKDYTNNLDLAIVYDKETNDYSIALSNFSDTDKVEMLKALNENSSGDVVDTIANSQKDLESILHTGGYTAEVQETTEVVETPPPANSDRVDLNVIGIGSGITLAIGLGIILLAIFIRGHSWNYYEDGIAEIKNPVKENKDTFNDDYDKKSDFYTPAATVPNMISSKVDNKLYEALLKDFKELPNGNYKVQIIRNSSGTSRLIESITSVKPDYISPIQNYEELFAAFREVVKEHEELPSHSLANQIKDHLLALNKLEKRVARMGTDREALRLDTDFLDLNKTVLKSLSSSYYGDIVKNELSWDNATGRRREVVKALGKINEMTKEMTVEASKAQDDTLRRGLMDILNDSQNDFKLMTDFDSIDKESTSN